MAVIETAARETATEITTGVADIEAAINKVADDETILSGVCYENPFSKEHRDFLCKKEDKNVSPGEDMITEAANNRVADDKTILSGIYYENPFSGEYRGLLCKK